MTEPTQQQRINRLAFDFMEWANFGVSDWMDKDGKWVADSDWNPFTCRDDAHDLLKECERRGLLQEVARHYAQRQGYWNRFQSHLTSMEWAWMAKPKQITEAVWAMAGLEGKT